MKTQTYYNAETEKAANICSLEKKLAVNCAGAVNEDYGVKNSSVRNDFYLIYMLDGKMDISFDGRSLEFFKGGFLVLKPGTKYMYSAEEGKNLCYLWVHFTGSYAGTLLKELFIETNKIEYAGIHGGIVDLWKKIYREFIIGDNYFESVSASILTEILAGLKRYADKSGKKERMLKSITYIHENYNKAFDIDSLAKMENLSLSYFRSRFKKATGICPSQYLIDRRMDAAAQLLENSDMKINEISTAVGYEDAYYFSRLFKKRFGVSPVKYKKQC